MSPRIGRTPLVPLCLHEHDTPEEARDCSEAVAGLPPELRRTRQGPKRPEGERQNAPPALKRSAVELAVRELRAEYGQLGIDMDVQDTVLDVLEAVLSQRAATDEEMVEAWRAAAGMRYDWPNAPRDTVIGFCAAEARLLLLQGEGGG